jgi:predicted MFS family arabinose efflux permease
VLTVVIDVPPSTDVGGDGHLIHWPAIPISLGFFASLAAMGGFLAFATLYAEDIGMADTSLPLLLYGSVVVVCRVVFATVPDRLPPLPLGSASLVVMGLGLLVVATWDARAGLLLGAAVLGVGITFSTPAFFSAIFATAAPNQRGAAAGTATAFMDLGLGFGPIALGVVAGAQGVAWAFGTAAVIAFAGAAWTTRLSLR